MCGSSTGSGSGSGGSSGSSGGLSGTSVSESDAVSTASGYGISKSEALSYENRGEVYQAAGVSKATGGKYTAEDIASEHTVSGDARSLSQVKANVKEETASLTKEGYNKEGSYHYTTTDRGNYGSKEVSTTVANVMSKNGEVTVVQGTYHETIEK